MIYKNNKLTKNHKNFLEEICSNGNVIVFNKFNDQIHVLNDTAAFIWNNCNSVTFKELMNLIKEIYPSHKINEQEILNVIDSMINNEILISEV